MNEFLSQRFLSQDDITLLKPFVNLQHTDLKNDHKQFFVDLDLMELGMEFEDSVDVERSISCSVVLKSTSHSRMLLETENLNLYVHYNMPPLDQWNPKPAVICWINER